MTKADKILFEDLVRRISNKWVPNINAKDKEEWDIFYKYVFKLNPGSEVMMKYDGTLFDLMKG